MLRRSHMVAVQQLTCTFHLPSFSSEKDSRKSRKLIVQLCQILHSRQLGSVVWYQKVCLCMLSS